LNRVGIFKRVGVAVVGAVIARPPSDRTLDGAAAEGCEAELDGERGVVGGVGPESVVAWVLLGLV
jgi:hypothetical protein